MTCEYVPKMTKYEFLEPILKFRYDIRRVHLPTQFEPVIRARRTK